MGVKEVNKMKIVFIGIVMIIVSLCFSSQAQAAQQGDFIYTVTESGAQISDYTGTGEVVTVPGNLGEDLVTSIGERAFAGHEEIVSIRLPQSVTSIGNWAFADCTALTGITIPRQATLLGEEVFEGCKNLKDIIYQSGVTTYKQAYRRVMTNEGYSQIAATFTLPSRDNAKDLDITSNNGAASYNYLGCQGKRSDGSPFDFEFGFGFKPSENKMMQFGIYYSLKAGSGGSEIKEWRWLRQETNNDNFYSFGYGTTHHVKLEADDGKIKVTVHDENNNLEFSGSWSFAGPMENGTYQSVRRVTSLLVPSDASATAKNNNWKTTGVGTSASLQEANVSNSKATTSSSGKDEWIKVDTGAKYHRETITLDFD